MLNKYNLIFHEVMHADEATRSVDQTDAASPDKQPEEDHNDGNLDAGRASDPVVQNPANAEAFRRDQAIFRRDTIAELLGLHRRVKDLELAREEADEDVADCRRAVNGCQHDLAAA